MAAQHTWGICSRSDGTAALLAAAGEEGRFAFVLPGPGDFVAVLAPLPVEAGWGDLFLGEADIGVVLFGRFLAVADRIIEAAGDGGNSDVDDVGLFVALAEEGAKEEGLANPLQKRWSFLSRSRICPLSDGMHQIALRRAAGGETAGTQSLLGPQRSPNPSQPQCRKGCGIRRRDSQGLEPHGR